ncbi:hypothetical protein ACFLVW_03035 [Chloroflexota bacterium]
MSFIMLAHAHGIKVGTKPAKHGLIFARGFGQDYPDGKRRD